MQLSYKLFCSFVPLKRTTMKQSSITSFYRRTPNTPSIAHSSHSHVDVGREKTTSSSAATDSAEQEETSVESPVV